jgi:aspartyl-tRNA(Asn)/glutamyl-tRNA(Gln) amidotransferase subunit C
MLINKKTLEYLADLGKLELKEKDKEKLLKDLEKVLAYFEELKKLDTGNIEPMAGGTIVGNIFREDKPSSTRQGARDKLVEAFPEEKKGFLRVPAVFE